MAARPRPPPTLTSSLHLDRILAAARNTSRGFPTSIWREEESDDDDDHQPAPALSLGHPILRALDSCPCGGRAFDQALAQLVVSGLFQHPLAAGRAVRVLCASPSSGSVAGAVALFAHLDEPDAFVCNIILRAYARSGDPREGLGFYRGHMLRRGVPPNNYTFPLVVKLCADAGSASEGTRAHARVAKLGFERDLFVQNSLIHMYSSIGSVHSARRLFDLRTESDLVTWNSMIDGYVKNGMVTAARELFEQMPERDTVSWNSMIDGYGKLGEVKHARELFDAMPSPNLVSWNIILAIHARAKDYRECSRLFDWMVATRVNPDEATLVSALTSYANLGDLERGRWVHSLLKSRRMEIESDVLLSTALLTMYSKCGDMDAAREVFDQMPEKSVVSWNSMIMGYGMHGHADKAILLFLDMEREGTRPNEATFVCLLSACAHAGLVFEGWWCFDRMIRRHDIEPKVEHYGCVVDLLSRAGLLDDSKELIEKTSTPPAPALLGPLLSACKTHSNLELAEVIGGKLMELAPADVGPYVLLSNIYAAEGRWDDVEKVRTVIREKGLLKGAGVSFVGWEQCEQVCPAETKDPVHKKGIMHSILSELGV